MGLFRGKRETLYRCFGFLLGDGESSYSGITHSEQLNGHQIFLRCLVSYDGQTLQHFVLRHSNIIFSTNQIRIYNTWNIINIVALISLFHCSSSFFPFFFFRSFFRLFDSCLQGLILLHDCPIVLVPYEILLQ